MIEDTEEAAAELKTELQILTKSACELASDDANHEITSDKFDLFVVIDDEHDELQIRKIEVFNQEGLGGSIVKAIHKFADKHNLGVSAIKVVSESYGFWKKMGYQEGTKAGEFYRVK